MTHGIMTKHAKPGANILYVGGYVQWCYYEPTDGEPGFWEILAYSGITKEMVMNATNKIIRAEDLKPRERY